MQVFQFFHTNLKRDDTEVSNVIPSVQPKIKIQMKDSPQRDSSRKQKDELQRNLNRKRHKPAWMKAYEL